MKGLQVTKKVRSDEKGTKGLQRCYEISYEVTKKGTKLRKRYESVMKRLRNKLPSYEKGTKLRKTYELTKRYERVTKMVRNYEKGTKLRKRYEMVTKRLRNKLPMSPTLSTSILVIRLTGTVSKPIPFWG